MTEENQADRIAWLRERGVQIELPNERKQTSKNNESSELISIVKIPCDEKLPYQEIKIPVEIDAHGDQLLERLRIYFKDGTYSIEDLKAAAGKQISTEDVVLSNETFNQMTQTGSVEAFPLSHPNSHNGDCKVSLYLDEVGQLKHLPPNKRATALANVCGFKDVPLVGDMFVGRYGKSPKTGKLTNLDFHLSELDSSAAWLKDIQKLNYEYGVAANQVAIENSDEKTQQGVDQTRGLRWHENNEIMEVGIEIPKNIKSITSKDVKIKFQSKSLLVQVKNTSNEVIITYDYNTKQEMEIQPQQLITLLDIKLAGTIEIEDSTWVIVNNGRELEITMAKAKMIEWGQLEA